jgi:dTMP kinase
MTQTHGPKRGIFITFEGGEGAGKSTQIRHLAERLRQQGLALTLTREPGGSAFAECARELLLDPAKAPVSATAQALLFYAARADHLDQTIRPALATGKWVLCDRFSDSTRAYQGAAGGVEARALSAIDAIVVGGDQPDLTVLLDLDPASGLARADKRRAAASVASTTADTYEGQRLEFHEHLRKGFLALAGAEPKRFVVLDATELESVLADRIWQHVSSRFALPRPTGPVGL